MASEVIHQPNLYCELPERWQWQRLDQVCEGIFDCPHSTPLLTNDEPYVVRSQDIRTGVFRVDQAARVSEKTYKERIARAEPRHGDLLFSREGTYFGIAAEVPSNIRVCLGQRMVLIRPDAERLNFRFLRYWLNSQLMANYVVGFRDGSVAERLNMPTIRGLPVIVPPLSSQRVIAYILGTLDDKIELNRKMNATLEQVAQALFKSWFVDFDPVKAKAQGRMPEGMDAETAASFPSEFEESELGLIPKGWRVGRVGENFTLTMGQSPSGETYNERGEGIAFYQGRTDFGFRYPKLRVFCTTPNRFANKGDTLVSVRAPVGDVNMTLERCCIGRGVAAIRHRSGSRSFTYYAMRSLEDAFLQYEAEGTVFGSINKANFESINVIEPTPNVISLFETIACSLDSKLEISTLEMISLANIRDALLPKLISGQLRIADVEKMAEAAL